MKIVKNKLLASICIGLAVTLIFAVLSKTAFFENLHLRFSNSLYQNKTTSKDIVIIAIDQKSLDDDVGLGRFQDWRRTYYAQVIENLSKAGAKVIGLDIIFNRRARGIPEEDLIELAKPLREKTENNEEKLTIFIKKALQYLKIEGHPDDLQLAQAISIAKNVVLALHAIAEPSENGKSKAQTFLDPIDPILKGKPNLGVTLLFPDQDNLVRRVPLEFDKNSRTEKTFPLKIAELILAEKFPKNIPNENGMMINLSRNPDAFTKISFVDIYKNNFKTPDVSGKIALIGATALTLQDNHPTPVTGDTPMSGVEIHANAIQTILDNAFLQTQKGISKFLTLLVFVLLLTFATNYLPIWTSILSFIILALAYIFGAQISFSRGLILDMATPFFALPTTYLGSLVYRYFIEYAEKRMLKKAFTHYVSPQVAVEIMKHPEKLKLGGERREVTVLFSDIENFTPLSEKLPPEEVVAIINEYMDAMTKVIFSYGGTVDKYEGDAIMAFFGAPLTQPDCAFRACSCALAMQQTQGKQVLNTRIGLSTGDVLVGNMGSHERFEYTVMGDTVNLGARLETLNKELKTRILISEHTKNAPQVVEKFALKEFQNITVKGKSEPLTVYELVSEK